MAKRATKERESLRWGRSPANSKASIWIRKCPLPRHSAAKRCQFYSPRGPAMAFYRVRMSGQRRGSPSARSLPCQSAPNRAARAISAPISNVRAMIQSTKIGRKLLPSARVGKGPNCAFLSETFAMICELPGEMRTKQETTEASITPTSGHPAIAKHPALLAASK
jgi:hypothetical protein